MQTRKKKLESPIRAGRTSAVQIDIMYLPEPGNWPTLSESAAILPR